MRAGLLAAVVLIGLVAVPDTLLAYVAAPRPGPSDRLEPDRLGEVREQLARQQALQRQLQARAGALAAEINALRAQGEQTAAARFRAARNASRRAFWSSGSTT